MDAQAQLNEELMKLIKKPGVTGKEMQELQVKMAPHDVKVRIDILIDISSQGISEKVNPAPAIAGGLVYRSQGEYNSSIGWREGPTYVFLGNNWKMGTSGGTYINFTPEKKVASSTVIQNIVVNVQADTNLAERIIQTIDWEALKALIKK